MAARILPTLKPGAQVRYRRFAERSRFAPRYEFVPDTGHILASPMQNMPGKLREALVAGEGELLVEIEFHRLTLSMMARDTAEETLLELLEAENRRESEVFTALGARLGVSRTLAKFYWYSVSYGEPLESIESMMTYLGDEDVEGGLRILRAALPKLEALMLSDLAARTRLHLARQRAENAVIRELVRESHELARSQYPAARAAGIRHGDVFFRAPEDEAAQLALDLEACAQVILDRHDLAGRPWSGTARNGRFA